MNRVYTTSQWERDFAKAFAAAVPLESMHTQARGALLAADNDEPEPRSQHPVIQAGEADAQKALRHSFTSRPATQEEAEENRREERLAGFDSSPWGVS